MTGRTPTIVGEESENLVMPGTRVRVLASGELGVVAKWPEPVADRIRVVLDSGRSYVCRPLEVEELTPDSMP
jgi:hypothetical protein